MVVIQGGFFPEGYLLIGILYAILLIMRDEIRVYLPAFLCILVLSVTYAVSGIVHSFHTLEYADVLHVWVYLEFYMLLSSLKKKEQDDICNAIVIIAFIAALISVMAYAGLIPLPGMVSNRRLQGVMQYANAMAIFLLMAVLLIKRNGEKYQWAKPGMLVALQLTMSMGGLLAYAIGVLLYNLHSKGKGRGRRLAGEAVEFVLAACFTAAVYAARYMVNSIPLTVGIAVLSFASGLGWKKLSSQIHKKVWMIIPGAMLGLLQVTAILYFRGLEAGGTFMERIVQTGDGIKALLQNPLFGLGPGRWAQEKILWQSSEYKAQLIHNSYLQIAVDAGIAALLAVLILIVLWVKKKNKPAWENAAIGSLLLHGCIDISFYFTGIMLSAFVIAAAGREQGNERFSISVKAWVVEICAVTLLLFLGIAFICKYNQ